MYVLKFGFYICFLYNFIKRVWYIKGYNTMETLKRTIMYLRLKLFEWEHPRMNTRFCNQTNLTSLSVDKTKHFSCFFRHIDGMSDQNSAFSYNLMLYSQSFRNEALI